MLGTAGSAKFPSLEEEQTLVRIAFANFRNAFLPAEGKYFGLQISSMQRLWSYLLITMSRSYKKVMFPLSIQNGLDGGMKRA